MANKKAIILLLLFATVYVAISLTEDQWDPFKWFEDDDSDQEEDENDPTTGSGKDSDPKEDETDTP